MLAENQKEGLKHKEKIIADKMEEIKKGIVREEEFKLEKEKLLQEIK